MFGQCAPLLVIARCRALEPWEATGRERGSLVSPWVCRRSSFCLVESIELIIQLTTQTSNLTWRSWLIFPISTSDWKNFVQNFPNWDLILRQGLPGLFSLQLCGCRLLVSFVLASFLAWRRHFIATVVQRRLLFVPSPPYLHVTVSHSNWRWSRF
jgi:hypothetical protein